MYLTILIVLLIIFYMGYTNYLIEIYCQPPGYASIEVSYYI